jgi:hypothetical protein
MKNRVQCQSERTLTFLPAHPLISSPLRDCVINTLTRVTSQSVRTPLENPSKSPFYKGRLKIPSFEKGGGRGDFRFILGTNTII